MLEFSPLAAASVTPLLVILVIVVADLFMGLLPGGGRLHVPIIGAEALFAELEDILNSGERTRAARIARGAMVCAAAVAAAAGLGWLAWWGAGRIPLGFLVDAAVLAIAVSQRRAVSAMIAAAEGLRTDDLTFARFALSPVMPSGLSRADAGSVARIAIEEGALGFLQRLAVPVFWYLLAGLPGVFVYAILLVIVPAVTPLDSAGRSFNLVATVFQHAFNFLPARIAALILVLAAVVVPGAHAAKALGTLFSHRTRYPDINGGWVLAPVAGALGLALCGPEAARDTGRPTTDWIGDGRTEAEHGDIRHAARLLAAAAAVAGACVATLILIKYL